MRLGPRSAFDPKRTWIPIDLAQGKAVRGPARYRAVSAHCSGRPHPTPDTVTVDNSLMQRLKMDRHNGCSADDLRRRWSKRMMRALRSWRVRLLLWCQPGRGLRGHPSTPYDYGPHMMWWGGGWYGMIFGSADNDPSARLGDRSYGPSRPLASWAIARNSGAPGALASRPPQ